MRRKWWPFIALVFGLMLSAALVACGEDEEDALIEDETPAVESPAAGGGEATAPAEDTPAADESPAAGETPPEGAQEIEISASNIQFNKDRLNAPAGTITIIFENNDPGIPHNFAIYPSAEELDNPIAATDIETGEVTQRLTVELEPGTYFFQCDVHPTTMTGALIVE